MALPWFRRISRTAMMMLGTLPSLANTASRLMVSSFPTTCDSSVGRYFSILCVCVCVCVCACGGVELVLFMLQVPYLLFPHHGSSCVGLEVFSLTGAPLSLTSITSTSPSEAIVHITLDKRPRLVSHYSPLSVPLPFNRWHSEFSRALIANTPRSKKQYHGVK